MSNHSCVWTTRFPHLDSSARTYADIVDTEQAWKFRTCPLSGPFEHTPFFSNYFFKNDSLQYTHFTFNKFVSLHLPYLLTGGETGVVWAWCSRVLETPEQKKSQISWPLQPADKKLEIGVVVLILFLQPQIRPFGYLLILIPAVAVTVTVPCHHPSVCFYFGLPYHCMCRESFIDVHIYNMSITISDCATAAAASLVTKSTHEEHILLNYYCCSSHHFLELELLYIL